MLKPNEIELFSMAFDEPMKELEMRIMQDIVRRIRINGEITRAADWQINRLYELGVSKREIKKYIKDSLDLNTQEINHLYKDIIRKDYERNSVLYKYKGRPQIPFEDNAGLQTLISAVSVQTLGELNNITQSLGFAVRQPDGKLKFLPAADYYQNTLDNAMLDIASGGFDYNTVLKRVVREMTNSGLRTVDYSTGHSNRIDVAARRAVMTGMSQLTAKVNEDNAKALDTDMFEVTWHGGARPSHQEFQGKWYTGEQLVTVCGLGTVTGLCGANCYHDYFPVIPGISQPTYTEEELAEMNRRENIPVEYNGKQYTKYEALQRQRRLETAMRAKRQEIKLLQDGGANDDDIVNAQCRYRGLSQEYSMFSKAMDIPQQRERIYVDGLGNIGVGKYKKAVDKSAESGIIDVRNQAKYIDMFNDHDIPSNAPITAQKIVDELNSTAIGKETLQYLENLPKAIRLTYNHELSDVRGFEQAGGITIQLGNCKNTLWAARTVIHECTHAKYGIGQSQWAECVCIAQELKHARNRDYLTIAEKRTIITAVKADNDYGKLSWRKGGTVNGRKK